MQNAINLQKITRETNFPMASYSDAIKMIVGENNTHKFYLDKCTVCPGPNELEIFLKTTLENQYI